MIESKNDESEKYLLATKPKPNADKTKPVSAAFQFASVWPKVG